MPGRVLLLGLLLILLTVNHGTAGVSIGLTDEQVRTQMGAPRRLARQIVLHRAIEQWHYGAPHNVRLTFECVRGQRPRLVRIQPLGPREH